MDISLSNTTSKWSCVWNIMYTIYEVNSELYFGLFFAIIYCFGDFEELIMLVAYLTLLAEPYLN